MSAPILQFTVPGKPRGKPRPIVQVFPKNAEVCPCCNRKKPFAHPVTDYPKPVKRHMQAVAMLAKAHWRRPPIEGPVAIRVDVITARPKNRHRRKDPTGRMLQEGQVKPDGDNAEGLVWDALVTAEVLVDDAWVTNWAGSKRVAAVGEAPHTVVAVYLVEPEAPLPDALELFPSSRAPSARGA